jgi:benzoyl-CoA reductase/2-hydroxyglutaryl-CoA dehydratase subunit BcrC/BadD/HgdB
MARINVTRLPLPQDEFDRQQQDILIRELENIIEQLNFTYQQELREEATARTWFLR